MVFSIFSGARPEAEKPTKGCLVTSKEGKYMKKLAKHARSMDLVLDEGTFERVAASYGFGLAAGTLKQQASAAADRRGRKERELDQLEKKMSALREEMGVDEDLERELGVKAIDLANKATEALSAPAEAADLRPAIDVDEAPLGVVTDKGRVVAELSMDVVDTVDRASRRRSMVGPGPKGFNKSFEATEVVRDAVAATAAEEETLP